MRARPASRPGRDWLEALILRHTDPESEDVWAQLHLPLISLTVLTGVEAILGGFRRAMAQEPPNQRPSVWVEADFEQVESRLSSVCLCTSGGLFCLLQLPHRVSDAGRLDQVCLRLNHMEMAAQDLPPHLGAWCPGREGGNPVYVSFLPNVLHEIPGIAVNAAVWALVRARWAHTALASMGVKA